MVGQTLGQRYKLLRLIGRGGMGSVYEAEQTDSGERVAIKVLHGHLLAAEGGAERRFRREAEAVLAVQSDHIVRMLGAGADEVTGQLYLVTEFLDGEDLQKLLERAGVLSTNGALGIAAQALRGLQDAHAAGVIHRDVKPANLFLARGKHGKLTVKLLDFGIAKLKADPLGATQTAHLTTTGSFLGSPLYMSPEQVQNSRDVDGRSDIWSLGCVLYACLAGRAPHQHLASVGQLLVAICTSPAPPLSEVAPWVAAEVTAVVQATLALAPDARYPSAAAMIEAICRLGPLPPLAEETLVSSRQVPQMSGDSAAPPSPGAVSPRVVVRSDLPIRGDDTTQLARLVAKLATPDFGTATLGSGPAPSDPTPFPPTHSAQTASGRNIANEAPQLGVARSGVPPVGSRTGARQVTVDPRRILGEKTELWTFSLDVHRHFGSLIARIWKALRRAGADLPPMTYGTTWALVEPRTGRTLKDAPEGERLSLEETGIRAGTVLWVVRPSEASESPGKE